MSRRPKLIQGELYWIKRYNVWVPTGLDYQSFYSTQEYIVRIKSIDDGKGMLLTLLASNLEQALTSSILRCEKGVYSYMIYVHFESFSRSYDKTVIQKFNPARLPLYLRWAYGKEWIHQQLKETSDAPNKPALPD